MTGSVRLPALLAIALLSFPASYADDLSRNELKSLDGQVQEIKSDVLNIASELNGLEERLLYPSGTQVAVFVALAERDDFRLDAVRLDINGELATHHIYSFKELDALRQGGVQRLYTGNVPTGDHQINVTMQGKLKNGDEFSQTDTFAFAKSVKPAAVGITLSHPNSGKNAIQVGDW
jgi:hypothetical protein